MAVAAIVSVMVVVIGNRRLIQLVNELTEVAELPMLLAISDEMDRPLVIDRTWPLRIYAGLRHMGHLLWSFSQELMHFR